MVAARALRGPASPRPRARALLRGVVLLVALPLAFALLDARPSGSRSARRRGARRRALGRSDGLRLRVWTVAGSPGAAGGRVVHGVGDTLESFTEIAARLALRGHASLLLDTARPRRQRGREITLGALEREDVRAVMDALRRRRRRGFVLIGHSMGAVAVLRAAADRADVRAVIVEAPYDTFRETVAHHAWLLYRMPRWVPVVPITIAVAEWLGGLRRRRGGRGRRGARCRAPLLAIADGGDDRMPEAVVRRVFDAHPGPKALWVAPGAPHVGAVLHPDYWPTVDGFLSENGL